MGFLTNILNSLSEPMSMYYGILTVWIAWTGYLFSRYGLLRNIWGYLLMALAFAFIGGSVGSVVTWLLYGGGFGDSTTSAAALWLHEGQFQNEDGLFTYEELTPFGDHLLTSDGSPDSVGKSTRAFSSQEYKWYLVSRLSNAVLDEALQDLYARILMIWSVMALLGIIISYFYVQNVRLRQEYTAKLHGLDVKDHPGGEYSLSAERTLESYAFHPLTKSLFSQGGCIRYAPSGYSLLSFFVRKNSNSRWKMI